MDVSDVFRFRFFLFGGRRGREEVSEQVARGSGCDPSQCISGEAFYLQLELLCLQFELLCLQFEFLC